MRNCKLKAAEAAIKAFRVRLDSELNESKSWRRHRNAGLFPTKLQAENRQGPLRSRRDFRAHLFDPPKARAEKLTTRNGLEEQRLTIAQQAIITQMAEQQARVDQMRTLATLKQKQLNDLKVRAGIDGVAGRPALQVGQHVTPGTMLGRVSSQTPHRRI